MFRRQPVLSQRRKVIGHSKNRFVFDLARKPFRNPQKGKQPTEGMSSGDQIFLQKGWALRAGGGKGQRAQRPAPG